MRRRVLQVFASAVVSLVVGQAVAQSSPSCDALMEAIRLAEEIGRSPDAAIAAAEAAGCVLPTAPVIDAGAPADAQIEALREALGAAQATVAELRSLQTQTEAELARARSAAEQARAEVEILRAQQGSSERPMLPHGDGETEADLADLRRQLDEETARIDELTASLQEAREELSYERTRALEMEDTIDSLSAALDESDLRHASLLRSLEQVRELQAEAERVALAIVSDRVGEILDGLGPVGCAPLEVETSMLQSARGELTPSVTVRGVVFGEADREMVVALLDAEPFDIAYEVAIQATVSGCPVVGAGFETFSAASAGEDAQIRTFRADEADDLIRELAPTSACADLAEILETAPVFAAFRDAVPSYQRGIWAEFGGVLGACRWEGSEGRYIQVFTPDLRRSYPIILLRPE